MLKKLITAVLIIIFVSCLYAKKESKNEFRGLKVKIFPFFVYSYKKYTSYFCLSGYMGDVSDLKVVKKRESYSFKNSLKIVYAPSYEAENKFWVGVFWQYPPNNWGDNDEGGYDISDAKCLFFFAKGQKGGELVEFKVGGIKGPYGDSDEISSGLISLTKSWKLYKIDLQDKDLKNIIGGFSVILQSNLNPDGVTMYLNDIYYSKKDKPENIFFMNYSSPLRKD